MYFRFVNFDGENTPPLNRIYRLKWHLYTSLLEGQMYHFSRFPAFVKKTFSCKKKWCQMSMSATWYPGEPRKTTALLSIECWLFIGILKNGLVESPHSWVVFHPWVVCIVVSIHFCSLNDNFHDPKWRACRIVRSSGCFAPTRWVASWELTYNISQKQSHFWVDDFRKSPGKTC